jgi:hypothetical protein
MAGDVSIPARCPTCGALQGRDAYLWASTEPATAGTLVTLAEQMLSPQVRVREAGARAIIRLMCKGARDDLPEDLRPLAELPLAKAARLWESRAERRKRRERT